MAGMGPAPKPAGQRRRKNATVAMTRLPAEGRTKRNSPPWPLPADVQAQALLVLLRDDQADVLGRLDAEEKPAGPLQAKLARVSQRIVQLEARIAAVEGLERDIWRALWRTPQSVAWERLRYFREVAQYARWKALAELGELDAGKEARQWSDRLGLSPLAMLRLRWEVAEDEVAEQRDRPDVQAPAAQSRLRVVDPGA